MDSTPAIGNPVRLGLGAAAALVTALVIGGCGSSADETAGVEGPSEVALEQVSTPTDNPFTPPVGQDRADITPPEEVTASGATTFSGDLPGLYGGTQNEATCDKSQLVSFLEANRSKADAWASTLGIKRRAIGTYVDELTPVILRTDARVTNHGFVDGTATPIPALLQAGTAVLVDPYGAPVVKCYCGNPLTAAQPLAQPRYVGTPWTGFRPGQITIIKKSTTIINVFRLYDPDTGEIFRRPQGTSGTSDVPPEQAPQAPTTTTQTTPTEPAEPPPTTTTEAAENPTAYFTPQAGQRGDQYTLYVEGFAPNVTLSVTLTRPDGVTEEYSIDTDADGNGSYTFPQTGGDTPLGDYTAVIRNPSTGAEAQATTNVS